MSCSDVYPSGQEIRIAYQCRIGGVLTDPAALRFKWRSPADTVTTTWTWGTDIEIVKEATGKFYVDFKPDLLRPGADAGLWRWRYETDDPETAEEDDFRVRIPNV